MVKKICLIVGICIVVVAAVILLLGVQREQDPIEPTAEEEILTISTLEKIINVSELSTFTAVYNGVVEVMNPDKADKIDYYVSYEAKVEAGLDIQNVIIDLDEAAKVISITLPEIYITDVNVDIASLDFMFFNRKADTNAISQEAYKICEDDVKSETENEDAILEMARKNAKNVLIALVKPIADQVDAGYTLVVN